MTGAQRGGVICLPEIFKTSHSNFGICRNFQWLKMKFCIQIIFQKSLSLPIGQNSNNSQDSSWDRSSDRKFRKCLVFNHKYPGIVNLGRSFKMLVFLRHFLSLCSCTTLKVFRNGVRVYAFISFLAYLLRNRVCMHSRNVNNKYCVVITPVEQSFKVYSQWTMPVDRNSMQF